MNQNVSGLNDLSPRDTIDSSTSIFREIGRGFADLLKCIHQCTHEHVVVIKIRTLATRDKRLDLTGGIEHVLDAHAICDCVLVREITRHSA